MGTDVVILLKKYFFLILFLLSFNTYSANYNQAFLKDTFSKIVPLAKEFSQEQQKAAKIISEHFLKDVDKTIPYSTEIANENILFFYYLIAKKYPLEKGGKKYFIYNYLVTIFDTINNLADEKNIYVAQKQVITNIIKEIVEKSNISLKSSSNEDIYCLFLHKDYLAIDDIKSLVYKDKKGVDVIAEACNFIDFYIIKILFYKLLKNNTENNLIKSEYLNISLSAFSWFSLFFTKNNILNSFIKNQINTALITKKLFEEIKNSIIEEYKNFDDFLEFDKKNDFIFDLLLSDEINGNKVKSLRKVLFSHYFSDFVTKLQQDFGEEIITLHEKGVVTEKDAKILIKKIIANFDAHTKNLNQDKKLNKVKDFIDNEGYTNNLEVIENLFVKVDNSIISVFRKNFELTIINLKNSYVKKLKNAKVFSKESIRDDIKKHKNFSCMKDIKSNYFNNATEKEKKIFNIINNIYEEDFNIFFDSLDNSAKSYTLKCSKLYNEIYRKIFKHKNEKLLVYFLIKNKQISFNKKTSKKDIKNIIDEHVSSLNIYSDNNNILNLLKNKNLCATDIDKLIFENYKGIDVLLYSLNCVKYYVTNILFYLIIKNNNSHNNAELYSSILDVNLSLKSWQDIISIQNSIINCLSMHNYKTFFVMENSLIEEIFNSIVNKYVTLDDFLGFDKKNNFFFDTYILNLEETSLRKKLIYYYLDKQNEELIKKINNKKCSELNELENKLDNFLSKINYDKKTSLIFKKPKSKSELLHNLTMNDQLIIEDYYKLVTGFEKTSKIIKIQIKNKIKEDKKQKAKPQMETVKEEVKEIKKEKQQKKSNSSSTNKKAKNISNTKILGTLISDLFRSTSKKERPEGKFGKIKKVISSSATNYIIRQIFTPEHVFKKNHRNNIEFLINASNQPFEEYQAQIKEISKNIYEELISIEQLIYLLGEDAYLTDSEVFYKMKNERETTITQALNLIDLMNDPGAPSSIDKSVQNLTQQIIYNLNSLESEQACFYDFIHTNEHLGSIKIFLFDPNLANKPLEEIAAIFDLARNEIKQKRLIIDNIMPYKYRMDNYYAAIVYAYNELVKINKAFFL